MKVFVTGHKGYIGSHVVELLKEAGHFATGCDLGLFEGCGWEPCIPPDQELTKDLRSVTAEDLNGHDAVLHLAAISNDPMGEMNTGITLAINRDASVSLARLAKASGVEKFVFFGSCAIYGRGDKLDLSETDPVNPLTAYATSKIESEASISALAGDGFSPVFMRNATAYGFSKMLRIDLVVNNLLASALSYGEIRVKSDGTPWRPLIHCRDIARAAIALMEAPGDAVHNRIINIGGNDENYQVQDIAEEVRKLIPRSDIRFTGEVGEDPRNYRVNFDLLGTLLPDFKLQYTLAVGLEELHQKMLEHGFNAADFESDQFVRLRTLMKRLELIGAN